VERGQPLQARCGPAGGLAQQFGERGLEEAVVIAAQDVEAADARTVGRQLDLGLPCAVDMGVEVGAGQRPLGPFGACAGVQRQARVQRNENEAGSHGDA
jgi:hypothetical protein